MEEPENTKEYVSLAKRAEEWCKNLGCIIPIKNTHEWTIMYELYIEHVFYPFHSGELVERKNI